MTDEKLRHFADALWRTDYLHGYQNFDQLWSLGIEDSLSVLKFIDLEGNVLDIGPGGGLPGLALAIQLPNVNFTLVDSSEKSCKFLLDMASILHLNNIEVVHARIEDFGRTHREEFDYVISRAVAELRVLIEYAAAPLKVNGTAIFWKGPSCDEELSKAEHALNQLHMRFERCYNYSIVDRSRVLLVFKKTQFTPRVFPRKAGTPERKPL